MFDDVAAHFQEAILASYQAYAKVRDGDTAGVSQHMRAALQLASLLFHFREHLPISYRMSRSQVVSLCPDYRLIADVTNASKHGELTRPTSEGPPLVDAAEDITELAVVTRYQDTEGEYSDTQVRVMVRCTDGKNRNLDGALISVLNFWGGELKRAGLLKNFSAFSLPDEPGSKFVSRSKARNLNLEAIQGLRFRQAMTLQKFNEATGKSEPIDLSGSQIIWRVYKPPPLQLFIEATPRGATQPIKIELSLTQEEACQFQILQTDRQRNEFVQRLAGNRDAEIRGKVRAAVANAPKSGLQDWFGYRKVWGALLKCIRCQWKRLFPTLS